MGNVGLTPGWEMVNAIIHAANEAFACVERPDHFTNHTHCCECAEHDQVLREYTPQTIPRQALGHMGWDPITFTQNQGFTYYLPALVRVVLTHDGEDDYFDQFLWHVEHMALREPAIELTRTQRAVVRDTLNFLLEERTEIIELYCLDDDLLRVLEAWEAPD